MSLTVWNRSFHSGTGALSKFGWERGFYTPPSGPSNKDFEVPKFIQVVFHNLSGYDPHLFVKNLGTTKGKIRCLPTNDENYISFSKDVFMSTTKGKDGKIYENKLEIRFIDSFRFMQTSLAKLVENLPSRSFKNLKRFYKGDKFELLRRKGVFPYD